MNYFKVGKHWEVYMRQQSWGTLKNFIQKPGFRGRFTSFGVFENHQQEHEKTATKWAQEKSWSFSFGFLNTMFAIFDNKTTHSILSKKQESFSSCSWTVLLCTLCPPPFLTVFRASVFLQYSSFLWVFTSFLSPFAGVTSPVSFLFLWCS